MKKPIVLIAAIAAVVGLRAAVALGNETTKVGTSVSIKFIGTRDRGVLHGTVSGKVNAKEGCRKQRKVALYRKNIKGLSGHRVSADRSNNRGRYRIDTVRLHGPWF